MKDSTEIPEIEIKIGSVWTDFFNNEFTVLSDGPTLGAIYTCHIKYATGFNARVSKNWILKSCKLKEAAF